MVGRFESPAERARTEAAWAALVYGATDLAADPLDDDDRYACDGCGRPGDDLNEDLRCADCVADDELQRAHERIEGAMRHV